MVDIHIKVGKTLNIAVQNLRSNESRNCSSPQPHTIIVEKQMRRRAISLKGGIDVIKRLSPFLFTKTDRDTIIFGELKWVK